MARHMNIILQGTVYFTARFSDDNSDNLVLRMTSEALLGIPKARGLITLETEATFDRLYSHVGMRWQERDDVVSRCNDSRWPYIESIWTFDLDSDVLKWDKTDRISCVGLNLFRERVVRREDFKLIEVPLAIADHTCMDMGRSMRGEMLPKRLNQHYLSRRKIFIGRLLADFVHQWRHVLKQRYNDFTFRRLAYAIVKIVTLQFHVREVTLPRHCDHDRLIEVENLPEWDFPKERILRAGSTSIVTSQHVRPAIQLLRKDYDRRYDAFGESSLKVCTYLILTVREILLYQKGLGFERYMKPVRLFDGKEESSDAGIELLLQATQVDITTPSSLHVLPTELLDIILDGTSAGPIERARMSCLLDAGSVFAWRSGERDIERVEEYQDRTSASPVESHIQFDGCDSGVAYI